jgi:hypothetical protein
MCVRVRVRARVLARRQRLVLSPCLNFRLNRLPACTRVRVCVRVRRQLLAVVDSQLEGAGSLNGTAGDDFACGLECWLSK